MRPVFLFNVGIVVFVIGSAASKAYGLLTMSEMAEQVIIEKLTAIIGIKAQERKRLSRSTRLDQHMNLE
jgi:hypothetical protein